MRVGVLLSGGVDSSVVLAQLAAERRYELKAYYLKIWLEDELSFLGDCPWEEDLKYARAVCEKLNVPLEIVPLQTEYHERVVSYALAELRKGLTPSPDIFCNQMIKFGAFWDCVQGEVDYVASGHYASIKREEQLSWLMQGVDPIKDQTYFLSFLSQEQLRRCLFPLGVLEKKEVRALAESYDLPTKSRPDSQGICFLGKIKYKDFVGFHLGESLGEIIDEDSGKVLGEHKGFWFHTIGQRKGLGLGGGPWFVSRKDVEKNRIYVRHEAKVSEQSWTRFSVTDSNWVSGEPDFSKPLTLKLRHGPRKMACTVTKGTHGELDVTMAEPDRGIAGGQFAVFYDQTVCLGGAKISALKPS